MISLRQVLPRLVLTAGIAALAGAAYADTPTPDASTPAAGTPAAAHAGQGWHGRHAAAGFRHVLRQLNLTAEQRDQIKAIYAQSKPRLQQLMADSRATRQSLATTAPTDHPAYDTLLEQAKANAASRVQLASDVRGLIYNVLSPAQQAQIPAIVAADRAARRAAWQSQHGQS